MAKKQTKNSSQNKPNPVISSPIDKSKTSEPTPQSNYKFDVKEYLYPLGLIIFTLLFFSPTTNYEFVNWDDDRNVFENKLITTLNGDNFWKNSKQIFKEDVIGNYNPLSIFSFALENRIYNDNKNKKAVYNGLEKPGKFHRTNNILHALCVALVYLISRRLNLTIFSSIIVGLLFAIHPMRIESVAWVTERKDVLFGVFYLLALLLYIKNKDQRKFTYSALIFIAFILSLLSKIQAVTLPLSMMTIDYLLDKDFNFKSSLINKIPYFLLSLVFGILGIMILGDEGSLDANTNTYPLWQRVFVGSYSFLVYLIKFIYPYRMSPMYPYEAEIPSIFYPTIIMLPITLYGLYKSYINNWRWFFFSLAFFIINIFFLLQILGAGQGFIADRFTYIAYLGLFLGLGYLVDKYTHHRSGKYTLYGICGVALLGYAFLSHQQIKIWENTATLWGHVLKYYNKTTLPYGNRANYYRDKKMYPEAIADYNAAIKLKPEPQTLNSRARLYFDTAGNDIEILKKALNDYNKAIELKPNDGEFWINRGATYARLGDLQKAIENINQGLIYKPDHASGYLNRFVLTVNQADMTPLGPARIELQKKALADILKYQSFNPTEPNTYYETARLKRELSDTQNALIDINKAIQLNNSNGLYFYEQAIIQNNLGLKAEARSSIANARKLGYTQLDQNIVNLIEQ
jgi:tetratricopeptide (TPR) repeat protein